MLLAFHGHIDVYCVYLCFLPCLLRALPDGETKRPHAGGVASELQDSKDAHQLDDLENLADFTDSCHGLQVLLGTDVLCVHDKCFKQDLDEVGHDRHHVDEVQCTLHKIFNVRRGQQPQEVLQCEEKDGRDFYPLHVGSAGKFVLPKFLHGVHSHGNNGDEHKKAGKYSKSFG